MSNFIVKRIEEALLESLKAGQNKYRAYFINTKIYAGYKKTVDKQLKDDGHKDVIVTK